MFKKEYHGLTSWPSALATLTALLVCSVVSSEEDVDSSSALILMGCDRVSPFSRVFFDAVAAPPAPLAVVLSLDFFEDLRTGKRFPRFPEEDPGFLPRAAGLRPPALEVLSTDMYSPRSRGFLAPPFLELLSPF